MAYILNVIHMNVPALKYKQKQLECDQLCYQAHLILQNLPDSKFPNFIINLTRWKKDRQEDFFYKHYQSSLSPITYLPYNNVNKEL